MHLDPGEEAPAVAPLLRPPTARLVLEYLVYQGHTRAAQAYARDVAPVADAPPLSAEGVQRMRVRQQIIALFERGYIDEARSLCEAVFPAVLTKSAASCDEDVGMVRVAELAEPTNDHDPSLTYPRDPDVLCMNMDVQKFIELVRAMYHSRDGGALADSALAHAQALRQRAAALPCALQGHYTILVDEVASLLAYRSQTDLPHPLAMLLNYSWRSALAAQINYAILATEGITRPPLLIQAAQHARLAWESLHSRRVMVSHHHPVTDFVRARGYQLSSTGPREDRTLILPRFVLSDLARNHSPMRAASLAHRAPGSAVP
ncbi:hypothetical protein MNAN1_003990 [Malassezia nana]|uniref:CRA domain-containing protein n=1 Tax=Malassezia nana TaxID=180528 RepID=A0AAF0J4G1_9BASI|nr:hypothetical protein MNAN1_003990 [Malassezia nana]